MHRKSFLGQAIVNDAVRPAGEQAVDARAIVACAQCHGARNLLGIEPSGGVSLSETSAEVAELTALNAA
jgi:mono/diheme cytochrome c family protein